MAARQITLKDIAGKSGVSVMTVSRALHNHPALCPETRARILQAAERLGYRPNPMVSALMRYRRTGRPTSTGLTLAFITQFSTRDGWKESPINREFFEGAKAAAQQHGYHLEEFWLREPRMTAQRLSQILQTRNVLGLLLAPLPVPLGHLRLDWDKFSAVALGYSLAWPSLNRVVDEQFHSLRLAWHRLRKLGYHRLGLALRARSDQSAHHHWTGGFLMEQQTMPPSERVPMFVVPDLEWQEATFQNWVKRHRPEVILSLHEEIPDWIRHMGLGVPQDMGFAHLNCPDTSGNCAGIYHNGRDVGATAIDLLVDMLHRNERGIPRLPRWVLVEAAWCPGGTLRPPKAGVGRDGSSAQIPMLRLKS
jgi:LacI family transcriptional regulator